MAEHGVLFRNECRFCEVGHTFDTDEYYYVWQKVVRERCVFAWQE